MKSISIFESDAAVGQMSAVSHGGRGSPKVKSGRLKNRKQPQPKKLTMEDQIHKEQKQTDVSCSKVYFAK